MGLRGRQANLPLAEMEQILDMMSRGIGMRRAAAIAGIPPATVHHWVSDKVRSPLPESDPRVAFARRYREIQARQIAEVEEMHRESRLAGNVPAMQWYLTQRCPEDYGRGSHVLAEAEPIPEGTPDDVAEALGK